MSQSAPYFTGTSSKGPMKLLTYRVFRRPSGNLQKNDKSTTTLCFGSSSFCITCLFLFSTGRSNTLESPKWGHSREFTGTS